MPYFEYFVNFPTFCPWKCSWNSRKTYHVSWFCEACIDFLRQFERVLVTDIPVFLEVDVMEEKEEPEVDDKEEGNGIEINKEVCTTWTF